MMAITMSAAQPRLGPPARRTGGMLDDGVLEACRRQEPAAFRTFVVAHERMVFSLLSRMLGRRAGAEADVEDLAQETFVRAYRAFPAFDLAGAAKPSTWLLTIATRLALDVRKRKRLDSVPLDDAEPKPADSTPELRAERRELGDALAEAASQLPDDQRAALLLADVHGLSIAEVATALETNESTAKTRLFRAREKMRAALRDEWRTP